MNINNSIAVQIVNGQHVKVDHSFLIPANLRLPGDDKKARQQKLAMVISGQVDGMDVLKWCASVEVLNDLAEDEAHGSLGVSIYEWVSQMTDEYKSRIKDITSMHDIRKFRDNLQFEYYL